VANHPLLLVDGDTLVAGEPGELTLHGGASPLGAQAHRLLGCWSPSLRRSACRRCPHRRDGDALARQARRSSQNAGARGAPVVHGALRLVPLGTTSQGTGKPQASGTVHRCPPSDARRRGQQRKGHWTAGARHEQPA
jgi:hypothetical protein